MSSQLATSRGEYEFLLYFINGQAIIGFDFSISKNYNIKNGTLRINEQNDVTLMYYSYYQRVKVSLFYAAALYLIDCLSLVDL